jgi:hypothetical protein
MQCECDEKEETMKREKEIAEGGRRMEAKYEKK